MRAAVHYLFSIVVLTGYGGQVCPFLEGLGPWRLGEILAAVFGLAFLVRSLLQRRWIDAVPLFAQPLRQLQLDLGLFLGVGFGITFFNMVVHGFPFDSGVKLVMACTTLGLFAAIDLSLERELHVFRSAVNSGRLPERTRYSSMTRKFTAMTVALIALLAIDALLIIMKDLSWIVNSGPSALVEARRTLTVEFVFVALVTVASLLNLVASYGRNLRAFFQNETSVLESVAAGRLDQYVRVPSRDEFGVIASYTNRMIDSLKERNAQITAKNAELERRLQQVQAMVDVSTSIISELDVDRLLEEIIDRSKEVMGAEASSLLLLDRGAGSLSFHVARGSTADQLRGATLALGQGIAGWVAESGTAVLVPDAYEDPRFDPSFDQRTGFQTRSLLSVPLKTKDDILGVLEVINKTDGRLFDQEDQRLFQSFANMGSISLENARLFVRTRKMSENLREALEKERWLTIEKEKMGAYIPKHVVDEISRNRERKLALGGKTVRATVLFSDIRGFTRFSENMEPQRVVTFLNAYMTAMATIIEDHGGLLDKFIGDGIMAVFLPGGADDNHALRAVQSAIQMQRTLARLAADWRQSWPEVADLAVRVGINTGDVVAGNVGSETRMDYTVIGDNVNVASRIEANGRGGEIHVSEATFLDIRGAIAATRLDPIVVKNRVQAVQIYSVHL